MMYSSTLKPDLLAAGLAGYSQVPKDWFPASQVRPLILEDPALVWLEYHGANHGLTPDDSKYAFQDLLTAKSQQFEAKWLQEMAPEAVTVCREAHQALSADKVKETFELMQQGASVIAQPVLWWAPERIYGVPDLLAHTSWVHRRFPGLLKDADVHSEHYVVFDLKFTTKIEDSGKAKDRQSYAAQVRLYSYMLGCLQGYMPAQAFLITRDRIADPFPIEITSALGQPLEADLAALRDQFIEIKVNGANYLPWRDAIVANNIGNSDERWQTAKTIIAEEKTPGRDAALVYQIGAKARQELVRMGYPNLDALLKVEPEAVPLESIKGIGASKARQIRAVLQANRSGQAVLPPPEALPDRRRFEFFVDYEYLVNVDVDFERQWPGLEGREMIFMAGVGWEQDGEWRFEPLAARAEDPAAERELLERFVKFLSDKTGGAISDPAQTALYHWTAAEAWQSQRAADRQGFTPDHPLRSLPWVDVQKVFLSGPAALPGAWDYGLKEIASALSEYAPEYATHWPDELNQGLNAMVMGWAAYRQAQPLQSAEFELLRRYLEQDCASLQRVLAWLRKVCRA